MDQLTPGRWRRIRSAFERALDVQATARPAVLEDLCGDDDLLRDQIDALLVAESRASPLLETPVSQLARPLIAEMAQEVPDATTMKGRRVGPYRLVREIGHGGMGTVYLAERDDGQFEQQVAVKLLRRELDTEDLLRRFLAERQILASLNHPNIARLLDGGETEDGRPYLAMEYVEGQPIDAYCDAHGSSVEDRLELFLSVAQAVQHAHRNLVVHRDLKPSNVLVSAKGDVKLLDFGIAKLLDPGKATDLMPPTRAGPRLLTPDYASPEQVRRGPITTTSDVYQLGLLLYEILTGHRPQSLAGRSPTEAEQQICERDPPPPSTIARYGVHRPAAAERAALTPAAIARARGATPERLRRRLRGDLDAITLRALRKKPEHRYASVEALIADLRRHLVGRPVRARGENRAYRLRKFLRRYRWTAGAAAAFIVLLAGYAATVTLKERQVRTALERVRTEAERAEQVTTFLMQLFEVGDPEVGASELLTARELLDRGAARALQSSLDPASQALRLNVIGRTYQYLGRYDDAHALLDRSLLLRQEFLGDGDRSVAESLYDLGRLQHARGQLDSAQVLFRQALDIQRNQRPINRAALARTQDGLSHVLEDKGDYRAAESLASETLRLRRRVLGSAHPAVAESLTRLASILRGQGRYASAAPLYREALSLRQRRFGDEHPTVAASLHDLAYALQLQGDFTAAEPFYRRALATYQRLWGDEHPAVAATTSNLGLLKFAMGENEAADSLYSTALAMRRTILGEDHPDVATSLGLLAALRRRQGEHAEAEALYRESLAIQRRVLGAQHPDMAHGMNGLAGLLQDRGDYAGADSLYTQVLAMRLRLLGPDHPAVAMTINDRGVLMREWGDYPLAESLLLQALEKRERLLGPRHRHVEQSLRHLVTLYEQWGLPEKRRFYESLLH